MMKPQCSLIAGTEGTTLRLSVAGELDRAVTGHLERALEQALAPTIERIVLDLKRVTFLDLAAIRTLLEAHARAHGEGRVLTVLRPTGTASRIFTLTRVGDVLDATDDGSSAVHPNRAEWG